MKESTRTEDGGSAFPLQAAFSPECGTMPGNAGMSLRDWFAGQALAGLTGDQNTLNAFLKECVQNEEGVAPHVATAAYHYADAMLKARGTTT